MDYLGLGLRWIHILSAVVLAGGIYFWHFVILPATRKPAGDERPNAFDPLVRPWSRLVMLTSALLLISGLVNFVRIIMLNRFDDQPYHMVGGIKLLLALVVFFISARLAGRSEAAARARNQMSSWSTANVAVVTVIVLLAGWLRYMPREPKTEPTDVNNSVSISGADGDFSVSLKVEDL